MGMARRCGLRTAGATLPSRAAPYCRRLPMSPSPAAERKDRPDRGSRKSTPRWVFISTSWLTLTDLDSMMARLKDTNASEPSINGRLKYTVNRAKPGDHQIDALMETSPTFRDATRHCYGRNGCQVFVETDLLASGPLGENMVIEFDHAFADRPLICLAQRNWAEMDWIWAVRGRRHLTAVVIDIDAGHALRSMRCTGRFSRMNEETSWIELIPPDKLNFVNERLS